MRSKSALLVILVSTASLLLATRVATAQMPSVLPLTEKEVVDLLKGKVAPDQLIAAVNERGVDFDLTSDIEKKLRKAKATDAGIEAVRNQGPSARAARQAAGASGGVTPEEGQAFQAIKDELDPDRAVQMVQDFETKYPNSTLLTWVCTFAANAYQQKGEIERVVEYGDKSLKLNPDNLLSLIIMSAMLPQPQLLKGSDLDREKRLAQAEEYAKQALQIIDTLAQQPNETPEAHEARKKQLAVEPHSSLGMIHLQRSTMGLEGPDPEELAKAEKEYKLAVALSGRPNPQDYYRLGETLVLENKLDEAIQAFTKASELGEGTILKTFAVQKIAELTKTKEQPK